MPVRENRLRGSRFNVFAEGIMLFIYAVPDGKGGHKAQVCQTDTF